MQYSSVESSSKASRSFSWLNIVEESMTFASFKKWGGRDKGEEGLDGRMAGQMNGWKREWMVNEWMD